MLKYIIILILIISISGCTMWQRLEDLPEDREGSTILYQGNGDGVKANAEKGVFYQRNL